MAASDLSSILKNELTNTLEQLLSKSSTIVAINEIKANEIDTLQYVETKVKVDFKDISSFITIFTPSSTSTKLEYLMLGGIADLKEHIDDEITDAVGEIISNVFGSFSTSVNAQNFPDIVNIKCEVERSFVVESSTMSNLNNIFDIIINLADDKNNILISIDSMLLPFFNMTANDSNVSSDFKVESVAQTENITSSILSELPTNLDLLYDVKLKLSVRLGTKVVLLKDILSWDIGEIIELEQMVNEPLEILVNGIKIGEGEAVVVEGKFGLKVKKIGREKLKLR